MGHFRNTLKEFVIVEKFELEQIEMEGWIGSDVDPKIARGVSTPLLKRVPIISQLGSFVKSTLVTSRVQEKAIGKLNLAR